MKRVNKVICVLVLVIAMCMTLATAASAAESGSVWVNTVASQNGKETTAMVVTDAIVTDGLIKITYNAEELTYKGVMISSEYVAMHAVNADNEGEVLISWIGHGTYESDENPIILIEVRFEGKGTIDATGAAHDAEGNELPIGSVDTSALEAAVQAANELFALDYTEESWAAMQDALKAAEEVLMDSMATQAEVDAAEAALTAAIEALVSVPEENPPTGDAFIPVAAMAAIPLLGMCALVVLNDKNKQKGGK